MIFIRRISTNADLVLLTESAKFDSAIVAKIKHQLLAGKSVVITSGLFRALEGRGIEDIVEARHTGRKIMAHEYWTGFGSGNGTPVSDEAKADILFPEVDFLTNDAWALVRAMAGGRGYPILFLDRYGKGTLYVWVIPDNFNDLYRLPPEVVSGIKNYVMRGFPVRLDGPGKVALFAYDNNTFIVESFLPVETSVRIGVTGDKGKLRNLLTGQVMAGQAQTLGGFGRRRPGGGERRMSFNLRLLPHSYSVFAVEE